LLDLKDGELIPSDSILIIENNEESNQYILSEVLNETQKEGNYYLENGNINGSGSGYGFYGVKKEYPQIYFKFYIVKEDKKNKSDLSGGSVVEEKINTENQTSEVQTNISEEIISNTNSNENSSIETISEISSEVVQENISQESTSLEIANSETNLPENTEQINSETNPSSKSSEIIIEEKPSKEEKKSDEVVSETPSLKENSEPVSQPETSSEHITEPVSEPVNEVSSGIVNAFLGFIQRAFLTLSPTGRVTSDSENEISGSVKYGEDFVYKLNPNENIKIVNGSVKTNSKDLSEDNLKIKIENNELTISTSYSEEISGFGKDYLGENNVLNLNLSSLNLSINEGNLKISINYNGEEISSFETIIQENQTIIIEENETSILNETNLSIEENETVLINETNTTELINNSFNLTNEELKILYKEFGNASVNSSSKLFKDRIIVTFSLNSYESKYSYDSNLSDLIIQELINKDRTNWLRDIVNRLSTDESEYESLNKFNESLVLKQK